MSRTIRAKAGVVGTLMLVATGAAAGAAIVPSSSAVGAQQPVAQKPMSFAWGNWFDCAPTETGGSGSVGWEVTTDSRGATNLEHIQRIRFSSECPAIVYAMTFDTSGDYLVRT